MNNHPDSIEIYKSQLAKESINEAKTIIKEIDAYLSGFSISSTLSFAKPDIEKYESEYMNFLIKISESVLNLTAITSKVASLTILADKSAKAEIAILLQKRFDAFRNFEKALYEYTENIDTALSNNKISASFIVSATQKLKLTTERLIEINT